VKNAPLALAADPTVVLTALRGHLYVAEDNFDLKENSMVYVGHNFVTGIGATWTPENGHAFSRGSQEGYSKTDYGSDRHELPSGSGGRQCFRSIGAKIISTKQTSDLLTKHWDEMVRYMQKGAPSYPTLPLVSPTRLLLATLNCKAAM
jgi:metallo-beta-lactamase class B